MKRVVHRKAAGALVAAGLALGCALAGCSSTPAASGTGATSSTAGSTTSTTAGGTGSTTSTAPVGTSTSVPPPAGVVVAPADVGPIVSEDTSINNRANAAISVPLQDSHETCLQDAMDDINYAGQKAAGAKDASPSFDQVPKTPLVPRESSYPATFSVIANDKQSGEPETTVLLDYVKASASAHWKLASSSEILGPTDAGVAVPKVATDSAGYVIELSPSGTDGLAVAPDAVAARVASAFTSEAVSGKLPAGVSAQYGQQNGADPHAAVESYSTLGSATVTFSASAPATPAVVRTALAGAGCALPAFRLADGGALVAFAVFEEVAVSVSSSSGVTQDPDRSELGPLLPAGTYSEFKIVAGDVCLAVVPPAGSTAPVEVIGQAPEDISETGVEGGEITT